MNIFLSPPRYVCHTQNKQAEGLVVLSKKKSVDHARQGRDLQVPRENDQKGGSTQQP